MKVRVKITTTETTIFDTGDLPINLIRDLLVANDGTFDHNYGPSDAARGSSQYVTDSVVVEPVEKGK